MTYPQGLRLPDGRVLETWDAGTRNGPVLVFMHGTPSSGMPYASMREALERHRVRTISWSRPGYGGSTRQAGRTVASITADLRDVLDLLGISRAYVAGWSGGGPHALACAALVPDRVIATAVIGGVAPYPAEGLDWTAGMGAENVEEFGAALEGPQALIGFKERSWQVFRVVTAAEVAQAFGDLVDEVDRGSLTGVFAEDVAGSFRDGLRDGYWGWLDDDLAFVRPWGFDLVSITGPAHIWQGEHDLTLVVDSFDRILGELLAS